MAEKRYLITIWEMSPAAQLMACILVALLVFALVYPLFLLAGLLSGIDLSALNRAASGEVADIFSVKYLQAGQHISLFVAPVLVWSLLAEGSVKRYTGLNHTPRYGQIMLVILISLLLIPVNSYTGWLNSRLLLPDWLSGAGEWIDAREKTASYLISELMRSENRSGLIINLIVIALIPAVGEELFFRGMLQKQIARVLRSEQFAVFIMALIFSFLHFQFYGFIPRLILGVVYGYLYLWSGSVWLPAIAHFINNGIPVLFSFLYGWDDVIETTTEISSGRPVIPLFSIIALVVSLIYCRRLLREKISGRARSF